MNAYNRFAHLYDELMNDFDYEKWFQYIEDIFTRYEKTPKEILEMACGTGNLSYYLGKKGYRLTCFDLSEEMLTIAYEKLRRIPNVKILKQDMIDFDLNKRFDSVVAICDSINYITDERDLLKVFENVWKHLDEDGIFIFDINSNYKLKEIIGNNIFLEDRGEVFYTWENYYDNEEDICEFYLTFFVEDEFNKYTKFYEEHREKAYKIDDILKLLNQAGFSKVDYYNAFTFEKPEDDCERINFVGIK